MAHLQSYIDRFRAKASKAKQAQSRIKMLERMELIAPAHVDNPFTFSFRPPESLPNPLLRMDKVSAGYGDKVILKSIKLNLVPGSRIGLLGRNGAGKSTLIKLLAGTLAPLSGEIGLAKGIKLGYFAQHQLEFLRADESPLQHLSRIAPRVLEQQLRDYLGGFGFQGDKVSEVTERFSGGEKARLVLALIVWQRPNLLLLDEPTNHLDLDMRQALTEALIDFEGALVVVSHDRHLLRSTTDDLYLVHDGQVEPFEGDLDDYQQWLVDLQRQESQQDAPEKESGGNSAQARKDQNAARRSSVRRPNRCASRSPSWNSRWKTGRRTGGGGGTVGGFRTVRHQPQGRVDRLPAKAKPGQIRAGRDGNDLAGCTGTAGTVNAGFRSLSLRPCKRPIPRMVARCMMRRCGR